MRNLRISQRLPGRLRVPRGTLVSSPFFFLSIYRFSHNRGNTVRTLVDALKITDFFLTVKPDGYCRNLEN